MNTSAVIKILRPINLAITFFSVVIAAVISSSFANLDVYVYIMALLVTFSFAAGNVINDVIDFEIDKINRPERVLPQGLISISFAKGMYVFFVLCSLILAVIISVEVLAILIGLNLLLLLYSTNFKKVILLSNFVVAFATAFPLVLGGIVVDNFMGGLIPAGFAFFTNFIREIIKDIEDIKGDSSEGVQTFPQKVGIDKSIYFVFVLLVLLIILDTFPFLFDIYNAEYFVIIMVVVNPIFVYIIKLLNSQKDLQALRKSSSLIKLSMIIGLVAILIGAQ